MPSNESRPTRRTQLVRLILLVSLPVVAFCVWSLIASFPTFDARQVADSALSVDLPAAQPSTPTETPINADVEPDATATEPPGGGPTVAPTFVASISRQAQLSYPKKLEIDRPSIVKFSVFTEGSRPIVQAENATPQIGITLPDFPDYTPRITVDLELVGARLIRENVDKRSQDLRTFNLWEWEILASESRDIVLKPHVFVDYVGQANSLADVAVSPLDDIWTTEERIPASSVVSNVVATEVGGWLSGNLLGLLGMVLGIPGTVLSWRELFGKKGEPRSVITPG